MLRTSAMRVQVVGDGHKPLLTSGRPTWKVRWRRGCVGRMSTYAAHIVRMRGRRTKTALVGVSNWWPRTANTTRWSPSAAAAALPASASAIVAGSRPPRTRRRQGRRRWRAVPSLDLADVRNDCSYGRAPRCARHPARLEADGSASVIPGHQHPNCVTGRARLPGHALRSGCCTDGPQRRIDGECRVGLIT